MKARPILFSGEMVAALLRNVAPKTMTRRSNGLDEINDIPEHWRFDQVVDEDHYAFTYTEGDFQGELVRCPYGKPGDRLWVREKFAVDEMIMKAFESPRWCWDYFQNCEGRKLWPADEPLPLKVMKKCNNIPSIFMKRWASRILLEIVSVRVERLQDISEEDAKDEGVNQDTPVSPGIMKGFYQGRFSWLWESINGPGSWEKNEWVWVIEFNRVTA